MARTQRLPSSPESFVVFLSRQADPAGDLIKQCRRQHRSYTPRPARPSPKLVTYASTNQRVRERHVKEQWEKFRHHHRQMGDVQHPVAIIEATAQTYGTWIAPRVRQNQIAVWFNTYTWAESHLGLRRGDVHLDLGRRRDTPASAHDGPTGHHGARARDPGNIRFDPPRPLASAIGPGAPLVGEGLGAALR
jgi:hypothetical protein